MVTLNQLLHKLRIARARGDHKAVKVLEHLIATW